jgi:hypothetical protein
MTGLFIGQNGINQLSRAIIWRSVRFWFKMTEASNGQNKDFGKLELLPVPDSLELR